MYKIFFGLKEKPFNLTPDPAYLFFSEKHREALSHLVYGIREKQGFIQITGEVGTGKTTVCRALLNRLDRGVKTALILNPKLSEFQLLQAIIEDFGMRPEARSKRKLFKQLNTFLIEEHKKDNIIVLIIDEAQDLSLSLLEGVRLISNIETEKTKLLQIILVGQPELKEKLNTSDLRQLRQRIGIRYHIFPLNRQETKDYIYHRLRIAGSDNLIIFDGGAVDRIYGYSGGIPRLINIICDKALLAGYVIETRSISSPLVERAIHELEAGENI